MKNEESIKLQLDALNENSDTYVSVTDLYGVTIFTNEDMEAFQARKEQEEGYYLDVQSKTFLSDVDNQDSTIQTTLFQEEMLVSKRQDIADKENYENVGYIFIGIIGLVVFVLAIIQYNIYRAIRRKRNADTDNLYRESR